MPLQGPADRVTGAATTYAEDGKWTRVTYHNTNVISFTDKIIVLNTGGYRTQTTKRRMNQAANQFGLGIEVLQRKLEWNEREEAKHPQDFGDNPVGEINDAAIAEFARLSEKEAKKRLSAPLIRLRRRDRRSQETVQEPRRNHGVRVRQGCPLHRDG